MRTLLSAALVFGFAISGFADIQDPPSNDYGPTRKLGRGLSNLVFGIAELPTNIAKINEREGNSAAAGYGVVRGVGRSFMRFQAGLCEIFTFPFPINRGNVLPVASPRDSVYPVGISGIPTGARQRIEVSVRAEVLK